MQRDLIGQQAGDDGLRVISFDVQAAEPGRPPAVEDALDADLVMGRAAGGAHFRSVLPLGVCCLLPGTLGADAGPGRHPKVACGWNLAGESGRRMTSSSGRTEARWPAEREGPDGSPA